MVIQSFFFFGGGGGGGGAEVLGVNKVHCGLCENGEWAKKIWIHYMWMSTFVKGEKISLRLDEVWRARPSR